MSKKHRPAPEKKPDKEQETPLVPAEAAEQAEALPEHKTEPEAVPEITETDEALNEIIDEVLGETAQPESTAEAEPAQEVQEAEAGSGEEAPGEKTDAAEEQAEQFTFKKLIEGCKISLGRYQLPEMLLPRFIAVYFLLSGCWILYFKHKNSLNPITQWREYVTNASGAGILTTSLIFLIACFALFSGINRILPAKSKITDQSLGIISLLFFDCTVLWRVNNFFLTTAVAFVTLVFINYLLRKLPSREPYEKVPWTFGGLICLGALVLVTFFIARASVAKHQIFGTACHDFGLFVQMFHSLANTLKPVTTCERDTLVSHFCVHASYIYYLLVPFYKAFPKESTLLIAQAVLAMGGAIPMFLIAKRRNFKGIALIFMTFTYIFSIGIVYPCFYDFHENAFLPTLLMWLFFAIDCSNPILMWIMTVLVCIVKEDAPLYIMCIGLFLFFEKKNSKMRWHGLSAAFLSGAYMILILKWLTAHGDGSKMTNIRFGILMMEDNRGLFDVIKNVLIDPAYFFSLLIHEDTLNFFLTVMLPLLFLPFLTKKIHRFWLMVPFIVMNLVIGAGYGYAANIEYQYIFGPICLLFYMCFLNLEDLGEKHSHDIAILLGSAAILFFVGIPLRYIETIEAYNNGKEGFQKLENVLDTIPEDAKVYATPFFISHIAERDELYLYDFNDTDRDNNIIYELNSMDFLVFGPNTEIADFTIPILEANGWKLFDQVENRVQIYQSPNYSG